MKTTISLQTRYQQIAQNFVLASLVTVLAACGSEEPTAAQSSTVTPTSSTENILQTAADGNTGLPVVSADAYVPTSAPTSVSESAITEKTIDDNQARQSVANAARISLATPSEAEMSALQKNNAMRANNAVSESRAYQIGIARPINNATAQKSSPVMQSWQPQSDGSRKTVTQIKSAGAAQIRVGIHIQSLPNQAVLRIHSGQAGQSYDVPGSLINQMIEQNIAVDGDNAQSRTYWTPSVSGETAVIEVILPQGSATDNVQISFDNVSHIVMTDTELHQALSESKAAASCNLDATCTLPPVANAIARMLFTDSSLTYVCTGTLLADTAQTQTPYFLTANHCISNQTVANTLQTRWFYRSSACNSTTLNSASVIKTDGADLLWTRDSVSNSTTSPPSNTSLTTFGTDTTLLKLKSAAPTGAMFAGWSTAAQSIGSTTYSGLHHPTGDWLKRSNGSIVGYGVQITPTNSDGTFSWWSSTSNNNFPLYQVSWSQGITEGGSSGSGLFLNASSTNPQIVGQLKGGGSSCSDPSAVDVYGRFDIAYQAGLKNWLLSPVQQAYEVRELADFNGDGKSDLLWRTTSGLVKMAFMNGASVQQWSTLSGVYAENVSIIGTGDFNGDGKSDIVWRNMTTGNVSISLMNGSSIIQWLSVSTSPIALITRLEGIGDFDGDGKAEMLWRNQSTGRTVLSQHASDGTVIAWPQVSASINVANTTALKIGDINGDGKDDIVWRNMSTGNVVISLMNGATVTSWKQITANPISLTVKLEAIGDFDGNGKADLLWRNTSTGNSLLSYHATDGGVSSWPQVSSFINPVTTQAQGAGDFNADGKSDIFWRNIQTGSTVISLMNGNIPNWNSIVLGL